MKENLKTNIDKEGFNRRFKQYLSITDKKEADNYFIKNIYAELLIIISNTTYNWCFEENEYEDVEATLMEHIMIQKHEGELYSYSGNYYNLVFTIFKNKFLDIVRKKKFRENAKLALSSYINSNINIAADYEF